MTSIDRNLCLVFGTALFLSSTLITAFVKRSSNVLGFLSSISSSSTTTTTSSSSSKSNSNSKSSSLAKQVSAVLIELCLPYCPPAHQNVHNNNPNFCLCQTLKNDEIICNAVNNICKGDYNRVYISINSPYPDPEGTGTGSIQSIPKYVITDYISKIYSKVWNEVALKNRFDIDCYVVSELLDRRQNSKSNSASNSNIGTGANMITKEDILKLPQVIIPYIPYIPYILYIPLYTLYTHSCSIRVRLET